MGRIIIYNQIGGDLNRDVAIEFVTKWKSTIKIEETIDFAVIFHRSGIQLQDLG